MMLFKYNGKTDSISGWAKTFGIRPQLIHTRITRGWSLEDAISRPVLGVYSGNKSISKNDAELMLNEMQLNDLPNFAKRIVKKHKYNGKKYGQFIRSLFRKEFDAWFDANKPKIALYLGNMQHPQGVDNGANANSDNPVPAAVA